MMDIQRAAKPGWIEVIAGSMFSGKSEELIRRLRRAQIAKQKVQIFKPAIDNRYSDAEIVSHSAMKIRFSASPDVSPNPSRSTSFVGRIASPSQTSGSRSPSSNRPRVSWSHRPRRPRA